MITSKTVDAEYKKLGAYGKARGLLWVAIGPTRITRTFRCDVTINSHPFARLSPSGGRSFEMALAIGRAQESNSKAA